MFRKNKVLKRDMNNTIDTELNKLSGSASNNQYDHKKRLLGLLHDSIIPLMGDSFIFFGSELKT